MKLNVPEIKMDMVSNLLLENNLLSEIKTLVLTTGTLYKIVMIPNHAQPAYTQGRMHRRFLSEIGAICDTRRSVNPRAAFA